VRTMHCRCKLISRPQKGIPGGGGGWKAIKKLKCAMHVYMILRYNSKSLIQTRLYCRNQAAVAVACCGGTVVEVSGSVGGQKQGMQPASTPVSQPGEMGGLRSSAEAASAHLLAADPKEGAATTLTELPGVAVAFTAEHRTASVGAGGLPATSREGESGGGGGVQEERGDGEGGGQREGSRDATAEDGLEHASIGGGVSAGGPNSGALPVVDAKVNPYSLRLLFPFHSRQH